MVASAFCNSSCCFGLAFALAHGCNALPAVGYEEHKRCGGGLRFEVVSASPAEKEGEDVNERFKIPSFSNLITTFHHTIG